MNLTTGTGLALLAGAILGSTVLIRYGPAGQAAYAALQGESVAASFESTPNRMPAVAARASAARPASASDSRMERALMALRHDRPKQRAGSAGGCELGDDKAWFTIGHSMPDCAFITGLEIASRPDVNGDGNPDVLLPNPNGGMGSYLVVDEGLPSSADLIWVHECGIVSGVYRESISSVVRGQVGEFIKSQLPDVITASAELYLRDIDGDGDLGLVVDAWSDGELKFWLENTGFQRDRTGAADLNHDGKVDGTDLGLLLAYWSQNQ